MNSVKQEVIRYRLERAREALDDAQSDLAQKRLFSASNRIYYAMFYAAVALLATRNLSSARHSGVIALLNRDFVKASIFPKDLARHLTLAFEMRSDSDYEDFVVLESVQLSELLDNARAFVRKVEELVQPA